MSVTMFTPITPTMRQRIEAVVDHLLILLDTIDGDSDLEDDDEGDFSRREGDALTADLYGVVHGTVWGGLGLMEVSIDNLSGVRLHNS